MLDNRYVYPFISATTFLVWLLLFLIYKSERKPFLFGLVFCISGPISEFIHIPDYWNPSFLIQFCIANPFRIWQFGIEDFVSGFAFSGICFGVFELHYKKRSDSNCLPDKWAYSTLSIMIIEGLLLISLFYFVLKLKACDSENLGMVITALSFYLFNRKYLKTAILISVIIALSYFLFFALIFLPVFPNMIREVWKCNNCILILGVPLDELLWAASSSFLSGPIYRIAFCRQVVFPGNRIDQ